MTIKDLRELIMALPSSSDDVEVRRHDSEYGARDIEGLEEVFGIVNRRYMWTYDTSSEATLMCDEGETVYPLMLIR